MPTTIPRVARSHDRLVSGVAAGWAERWGIEPTVLRVAVGLLSLCGVGLVLYGIAAALSGPPPPQPAPRAAPDHRRHLSVACATGAVLVASRTLGLWPGDATMLAAGAVALGTAALWSTGPLAGTKVRTALQVLGAVVLVGVGIVSLADRTGGLADVGASAAAVAVVVVGLGIVGAPAAGRLLRSLDDERARRIREDERATVAAHLHDSVLQSLVLMQRSNDSRHIVALARRQERELRTWLYGGAAVDPASSLAAALAAMAVEVEDDHDLRVELVTVGDQPFDDAAEALVAALREAIVNAARHAGVEQVDVFVEADDTELSGYVRDTGAGFDRATVPPDRRGIRDSIERRIERAGGLATVVTRPGAGTEVELRVPRRRAT